MSDLFSAAGLDQSAPQPLADILRPTSLDDVVGQEHLLKPDAPLGRMLERGHLASIVFWGPPGVGKTTIARLLAERVELEFEPLSAVFSGVKDLRAVFDRAEGRRSTGRGTLLFVDEIHRFNRAQQDGFLPFVESGVVTLIGATTENPSFEVNGALLSRCQVLVLKRLDDEALELLLERAERHLCRSLPLTPDARKMLRSMADGDGRYLLNLAEQIAGFEEELGVPELTTALQKRAPIYDKDRDEHYNLISALHKSVRGSDPDAALYWFARMIAGGEDPLYIGRRLLRMASEDIGLADPTAILVAAEAVRSYERLGSPEGELALVQALVHLACAPKSNAAYLAYKSALAAAGRTGSLMPPKHILNAPTDLMRSEGYGDGYIYDPDTELGFSGQDYFPEGMKREQFYQPTTNGNEKTIAERLDQWTALRSKVARQ